jgi:hypothetical protein
LEAATAKEIAVIRHASGVRPDGSRIITVSSDGTGRMWDVHVQGMSVQDLLLEACARLDGVTKLTRHEMRLAGYADSTPEIDVCKEQ